MRGLRPVGALVVATVLAAVAAPVLGIHAGTCTDPRADGEFACGELLVALQPLTETSIETVVSRQSGTPADILQEHTYFGAFTVAVPIGREAAMALQYGADPDVEFARLVGANILAELPDVAVSPGRPAALVWLGAVLLAATALLSVHRCTAT